MGKSKKEAVVKSGRMVKKSEASKKFRRSSKMLLNLFAFKDGEREIPIH